MDEGQQSQKELKKLEDDKLKIESSIANLVKEMSYIREEIEVTEIELGE